MTKKTVHIVKATFRAVVMEDYFLLLGISFSDCVMMHSCQDDYCFPLDGTHDVMVTFPANLNTDELSGRLLTGCIYRVVSALFFRSVPTSVVCCSKSSSASCRM